MLRIALAAVVAVGLTFAADAEIGPLCQTPEGSLIVCHPAHRGASQIGPLCQTPEGSLIVCHPRHGAGAQIGPLCQNPDGGLVVCHHG
jgi:hypothetical protein